VTYDGWPLYYWQNDAAIGDATGEGANDVWFTVAPSVVGLGTNEELGDFLVAPNGKTLYMFSNDVDGTSTCSGDCATNWPPYTVYEDTRLVAPEGFAGELTTVAREDGKLQVTYNGMPLYFFANDAAAGDTTGQGVGEKWWVVAP
jgi:predicted lipoprotein with Yx(FWY)xxD motif